MAHLKENDMLTPSQYGFVPGRSISLQLLRVMDDWTEAWENDTEIDCAYLDFSKAFDWVPHRRLIAKLNSFAIEENTIAWIQNFLSNREQQVIVGDAVSEKVRVTSGIPQGSVLGPILFLLFINDLPDRVTSRLLLFADDTKIYAMDDLPALQADLDNLAEWSQEWQLTFNEGKCKHLHIGRRTPSTDLKLNDHTLERVNQEKDLGVIFESSLRFREHVQAKTLKANSMFGIIRRSFHHLDSETFLPLYKGMVRSHLDFCASVYHPYHQQDIDSIEAVQ
jgi:hypothetical protein